MKVRYPEMDFSDLNPHWAPCHEFAHYFNAFSTVPAHIEPYLVKVMTKAKKEIDPSYEQLHEDVAIFNKQEVQHCKQHLAFNKRLHELGYEKMLELEKTYKDDYERFLTKKSLRFNVAYCEGFEAMGSIAAQTFFEDFNEYFEGADENVVNLWKWHLAEEFEHRTVCYDVYHALYGKGVWAYLYRVGVYLYSTYHIGKHSLRVYSLLNETDRQKMTAEEDRKASRKRQKAVIKEVGKAMMGSLLKVLLPSYNPLNKKPSDGMEEILAAYPDTRQV